MEGHSGGQFSGGNTPSVQLHNSVRLHNLVNLVVSRRHSRWCPVYGGRSGGLLSGGDAHSGSHHNLANLVVGRGHSRWYPVYEGV